MQHSLYTLVLVYSLGGPNPVQCKKYDLESEALQSYGENLNTVIKRFRRSPEYVSILNDKVEHLKKEFKDMLNQINYAYTLKLEKTAEKDNKRSGKKNGKSHNRAGRRQAALPPPVNTKENSTTTMSPVEKLDAHAPLQSQLSVSEKNHYKDLGFEYAGNVIHALIAVFDNGFKKSESTPNIIKSTFLDDVMTRTVSRSTTTHPPIHKITATGSTRVMSQSTTPDNKVTSEPPSSSPGFRTRGHKRARYSYRPRASGENLDEVTLSSATELNIGLIS